MLLLLLTILVGVHAQVDEVLHLPVCSGHGRELTKLQCECDDGWFGPFCTDFDCNYPQGGVWNHDYNNPMCACHQGWEGVHCRQNYVSTTAATAIATATATSTVTAATSTNSSATINTIEPDSDSPAPAMPVGSESGSGPHTSAALYIGIAIGIAAMCGVMIIAAMMYRSRHRFHDLKQRLLNPRLTSASASTELVLMKQPPPVFTTTVTPQLQPAAAGIVCMPHSASTATSTFAEPQQA